MLLVAMPRAPSSDALAPSSKAPTPPTPQELAPTKHPDRPRPTRGGPVADLRPAAFQAFALGLPHH